MSKNAILEAMFPESSEFRQQRGSYLKRAFKVRDRFTLAMLDELKNGVPKRDSMKDILNREPNVPRLKVSKIDKSFSVIKKTNDMAVRRVESFVVKSPDALTYPSFLRQHNRQKQSGISNDSNSREANPDTLEIRKTDKVIHSKIKRVHLDPAINTAAYVEIEIRGEEICFTNKENMTKRELTVDEFFKEISSLYDEFLARSRGNLSVATEFLTGLISSLKASGNAINTLAEFVQMVFFDRSGALRVTVNAALLRKIYMSLKDSEKENLRMNGLRLGVYNLFGDGEETDPVSGSLKRFELHSFKRKRSEITQRGCLTLKAEKQLFAKSRTRPSFYQRSKPGFDCQYLKALYAVLLKLRAHIRQLKLAFIQKGTSQCATLTKTIDELVKQKQETRTVWNELEKLRILRVARLQSGQSIWEKDKVARVDLDQFRHFLKKNSVV